MRSLLMLLVGWPLVVSAAEDDEVVVGPIRANPNAEQMNFGFQTFDQMLFQSDGNAQAGVGRLRTRARLQLSELSKTCDLSEPQRQKLELAARGDIQRFLEEVEFARRKFDAIQDKMRNDPNVWNEIWQEISPLHQRLSQGVTGPDSLYDKVLPKILSSEQRARHEEIASERRRYRYEASIAAALYMLEGAMALKQDQREELTKLLLKFPIPKQTNTYDQYLVILRLGALPPEKIEPIFDERQRAALKRITDQYRGFKEQLIAQGVLSPEDLDVSTPEAKP